ncbi:hypothetical protein C8Q78DRAFT_1027697 [Trametes maxima]|nr:hypothetical protein C8Q78DRAFT_1027697 [Trametes maxima]
MVSGAECRGYVEHRLFPSPIYEGSCSSGRPAPGGRAGQTPAKGPCRAQRWTDGRGGGAPRSGVHCGNPAALGFAARMANLVLLSGIAGAPRMMLSNLAL